jgi:hypothetical protein
VHHVSCIRCRCNIIATTNVDDETSCVASVNVGGGTLAGVDSDDSIVLRTPNDDDETSHTAFANGPNES